MSLNIDANNDAEEKKVETSFLMADNISQSDSSIVVISKPSINQSEEDLQSKKCPFCFKTPKLLKRFFPPRGLVSEYLTRILVCFLIWSALYTVVGDNALPGGNVFSLFILLVAASLGAFLIGYQANFHLPPLLGMLIVGFLLRNVDAINIAKNINPKWSSTLRSIALVVILLRSGLGLDIDALKKLRCTVIRLAFVPCVVEAVTVAVVSHFLLSMPWLWAFQLGFILSAVSPAVVVPSMLNLQANGYGVQEGIPTMVMAASSCDDVLAISMFGVFLGIAFSEGDIYFNVFRGPIEILIGLVGGAIAGSLVWYFPWKNSKSVHANRLVILLAFGLVFVFGSILIKFPGAGALGTLTLATTAGYGWGGKDKLPVQEVLAMLWDVFQPLLFGLIGAEVGIEYLDGSLIGRGLGTLFIGLFVRVLVVYVVVSGNKLNIKEKLFCTVAWLPKATVQAAIGSIPLDTARRLKYHGKTPEYVGIEILTIAVLAILVTAPLGAVLISITGPKWLKKKQKD